MPWPLKVPTYAISETKLDKIRSTGGIDEASTIAKSWYHDAVKNGILYVSMHSMYKSCINADIYNVIFDNIILI